MPIMCVASTGGHLAQLYNLAPRVPGFDEDAVWVTFDSPQSRSLLADRKHHFVQYVGARMPGVVAKNALVARRLLRETDPELVVSTGSAIAASFFPLARLYGIPAAFIESASRAEGPSLTGRAIQYVPGVQTFTQYENWSNSRWRYVGSIFDQFEPALAPLPVTEIKRAVVTVGTMEFGFRRLFERLIEVLPVECETVWQVGSTDVSGLPITAHESLPDAFVKEQMAAADVVIAHAGIGSALSSLELGKCPLLVPREHRHGEHIDDHQRQIATLLDGRGLATHRSVDDLRPQDLLVAANKRAAMREVLPPLNISRTRRHNTGPRGDR